MNDEPHEPQEGRFHPHSVNDILDELRELAGEQQEVAIGDVLAAMGGRSYGPFLLIPGLLELTPLGAIPGVPTFLAMIAALTAVQLLIGRKHLWLPHFIACRSRQSEDVRKAADKLQKLADWLDKWFHGRLKRLTHAPFTRIAAAIILLLCLTVPPLEFLPFASSAPMAAVAAFGLALLVRDGLLMVIATALSVGALALGMNLLGASPLLGGGG